MTPLGTLGLAVALAAVVGCGDGTDVRRPQAQASQQPSSSQGSANTAPPSAEPGGPISPEEVLAFAGLRLPAGAQSVQAVVRPTVLPSYRITLLGDRSIVDGICDQMGGTLRIAGSDLPANEIEALGLSAQPPQGSPTCASSRRDRPRVQRQVIGVAQGSTMLITIHVLEFPAR